MEKGRFIVKNREGNTKKYPLFESEISEIQLKSGNMISSGTLACCGFWRIDCLFLTQKGKLVAMLRSLDDDSHVKTRVSEYEALKTEKAVHIAKQFVLAKLEGQNQVLKKYGLKLLYEEKFELAYGNWVQKYASSFNFVRDNMGDNGVEKSKNMSVEALKRRSSGPAMFLLKLMRAVSPQTAFRTFAKQMSYQWQLFTPLSVSKLSGNRLVVNASHCKVLDYAGSEVVCAVSCQDVTARWLEDQFKLKMTTNRQGKSCTITIDRK